MLLDGQCELVTRRNASGTPRGGLVVFCSLGVYLFGALGDTTGIYSKALTPFQQGMRGTSEKLRWLPMHVTMLQEDCSCYAIVGLFCLRQLFFATFDLKVQVGKGQIQTY
jgi:hypothetical protein